MSYELRGAGGLLLVVLGTVLGLKEGFRKGLNSINTNTNILLISDSY